MVGQVAQRKEVSLGIAGARFFDRLDVLPVSVTQPTASNYCTITEALCKTLQSSEHLTLSIESRPMYAQ